MRVFTVAQVAEVCKVEPRAVRRWLNSRRLEGYRITGTQDWRITRENLIKFLKEYDMPLGDLEEDRGKKKVLLLTSDRSLKPSLRETLKGRNFDVASVGDEFKARCELETFRPDVFIVDFVIGSKDAISLCIDLKQHTSLYTVDVIALLPAEPSGLRLDQKIFKKVLTRPIDLLSIARTLEALKA